MIEELSKQVGEALDLSGFISIKSLKKIDRDLLQANIAADAKDYASLALFVSAASALLALLFAYYFSSDVLVSTAVLFAAFALLLLGFLKYPESRKKTRAEEMERELAIALRSVSIELRANTPFEKTLRNLARAGHGELSSEAKKMLSEIELGGKSPPEALKEFADRVDSLLVHRACMQLVFAYEHGLQTEGLKKLADELVSFQKVKSQQYAAQMAFFGLLFISVSCIVPALFAAYVIVGSSFLETTFTPSDVLLAFVLGFPLADAAILYYLKAKTPKVLAT
ncbi:type II secretion system F family protein [Candidatus Micrarchaeota archaeon]|nr:type II secretion system F family protein [Candidatus Micrarchaeota archaeon]